MLAVPSTLRTESIEWAIRSILVPQLTRLHRTGRISAPGRYADASEAVESMARLFRAQIDLSLGGRKQTLRDLAEGTRRGGDGIGHSIAQIQEMLATVADWRGLIDDLRLCESDRGAVPLENSVFTLKSAPWQVAGPNVFPASSEAFPSQVEEELERHDRLPATKARRQGPATDSTIYLVEANGPGWTQVLRAEGMPEGTKWDPAQYDDDLRGAIEEALELQAGARYPVSTDEILREAVLGSFFSHVKAAGRASELPVPIESGWLSNGVRGERYRFLGGELAMIRFLQGLGVAPFFDLPRTLVDRRPFPRARRLVPTPNLPTIPAADCSFVIDDGREIPGMRLPWAAETTFGSITPMKEMQGVFQLVSPTITAMAGVGPDAVEYAVANARVGKYKSRKRFRAGLIVRNGPEGLSGWGLPGWNLSDELSQRRAIVQSESHIERMRPDGEFQRAIAYVQERGVQTMGITLSEHKLQRESLVLAADILIARASFGR
jgi:hypothetical protein